MGPPQYPAQAYRAGATGIVHVVLRLDADGTVAEAHAEQVDMTVVASENVLGRHRLVLAQAALRAARGWTYDIAPQRLAQPGPIELRMPVEFKLHQGPQPPQPAPGTGRWRSYVPGPYVPPPWHDRAASRELGAMVPGQLYPADGPVRLRPPAAGG